MKATRGETHDISNAECACGQAMSVLHFGTASHQESVWKG